MHKKIRKQGMFNFNTFSKAVTLGTKNSKQKATVSFPQLVNILVTLDSVHQNFPIVPDLIKNKVWQQ